MLQSKGSEESLNKDQEIVYNHLVKVSNEENLVESLFEIEEFFQSVNDEVLDAYERLSKRQFLEVIHKIIEIFLSK
jgi:hypothetical protein